MLDTPQIAQTAAQLTAVIRLIVPREEIRQVMGPGIGELLATIAAQGIALAGPIFSRHFRIDPAIFDFEIGVPVSAPVAAAKPVAGDDSGSNGLPRRLRGTRCRVG